MTSHKIETSWTYKFKSRLKLARVLFVSWRHTQTNPIKKHKKAPDPCNRKNSYQIFLFFLLYFFSQQSENYFKKGIFVLSRLSVCFVARFFAGWGELTNFSNSIRLIRGLQLHLKCPMANLLFLPPSRLSWWRLTKMKQWRRSQSTRKWRNHRLIHSHLIMTANTTRLRPSLLEASHHKSGLTWSEFTRNPKWSTDLTIAFPQKILLLRRRDACSPRRTRRQPGYPARCHAEQHRFLWKP